MEKQFWNRSTVNAQVYFKLIIQGHRNMFETSFIVPNTMFLNRIFKILIKHYD